MLADQAAASTPQQTPADPRDPGSETAAMTQGLIPAGRALRLPHHLPPDGVPSQEALGGPEERRRGQHSRSSRTLCVVPASGRQTHNDSSLGGMLAAPGL